MSDETVSVAIYANLVPASEEVLKIIEDLKQELNMEELMENELRRILFE